MDSVLVSHPAAPGSNLGSAKFVYITEIKTIQC